MLGGKGAEDTGELAAGARPEDGAVPAAAERNSGREAQFERRLSVPPSQTPAASAAP